MIFLHWCNLASALSCTILPCDKALTILFSKLGFFYSVSAISKRNLYRYVSQSYLIYFISDVCMYHFMYYFQVLSYIHMYYYPVIKWCFIAYYYSACKCYFMFNLKVLSCTYIVLFFFICTIIFVAIFILCTITLFVSTSTLLANVISCTSCKCYFVNYYLIRYCFIYCVLLLYLLLLLYEPSLRC